MFPNHTRKLWLWVLLCAAVIVTLWATVFYPTSLKFNDVSGQDEFSEFKNKINSALSIFKNKKTVETTSSDSEDNIQNLRERVFGDSVKK